MIFVGGRESNYFCKCFFIISSWWMYSLWAYLISLNPSSNKIIMIYSRNIKSASFFYRFFYYCYSQSTQDSVNELTVAWCVKNTCKPWTSTNMCQLIIPKNCHSSIKKKQRWKEEALLGIPHYNFLFQHFIV